MHIDISSSSATRLHSAIAPGAEYVGLLFLSSFGYIYGMFTVQSLPEFEAWLSDLSDDAVRRAVAARIYRMTHGLFGDVKFSVAENVHELRIHLGAGWRVYFTQRAGRIVVLLAGGSKRTQKQDLKAAENLAKALKQSGNDNDNTIH